MLECHDIMTSRPVNTEHSQYLMSRHERQVVEQMKSETEYWPQEYKSICYAAKITLWYEHLFLVTTLSINNQHTTVLYNIKHGLWYKFIPMFWRLIFIWRI